MGRNLLRRFGLWLLEIEMGFVWGVAGLSIIVFVFAAIWYIDPALLTLVLQFRQAKCTTIDAAFLVGISNCSWTSCRLGCTREVYQCWQIQVSFEYVSGSVAYRPPWSSISSFASGSSRTPDSPNSGQNIARLYPNVRGCGYPPDLNCEDFFARFGGGGGGPNSTLATSPPTYSCWVSTVDPTIAMTEMDLERAKEEVILSLIPLLIFIVFVLYAFCRLGVFAVCNPLKVCPKSADDTMNVPTLTPKKLIAYKRGMALKKAAALAAFQQVATEEDDDEMIIEQTSGVPQTIEEEDDDVDNLDDDVTAGGGEVHILETHAEVLPIRPSRSGSVRSTENDDDMISLAGSSSSAVERFRRKRQLQQQQQQQRRQQQPFMAFGDNDRTEPVEGFLDDFDTNTVINDLFIGEELEMMDRERLVAVKTDVLSLEDIAFEYDNTSRHVTAAAGTESAYIGESATSETRLMSSSPTKTSPFNVASLRKKSAGSNISTWDDFEDVDSSFGGSVKTGRPSSTRSTTAGSGRRKAVKRMSKDMEEDEFEF